MEPRGGCCIARCYVGGGYNMHKVDRIMLRYRPIAPKPPVASSVSTCSSQEKSDTCVKNGRGKRKYVKNSTDNNNTNSNKRCRRKRKVSSEEGADPVVTLPLLPESKEKKQAAEPMWLSFSGGTEKNDKREMLRADPGVSQGGVRLMGSYLTVECVTETWVDEYGLGLRSEEKMMNLEKDTCPGIITDRENRVVWANKAYREMVGVGDSGSEMMVWLLMKQWVKLPVTSPAFTCRVSWVRCGKSRPITLPCDVWQMSGGGFAWRLDVNAALSLGR